MKSTVVKYLAVLLAVVTLMQFAPQLLNWTRQHTPVSQATFTPSMSYAAPIVTNSGVPANKEMTVASAITTKSGLLILNDRPNYRDPATTTVVVDAKSIPGMPMDAKQLIGRTISVQGTSGSYNGRPQIIAQAVSVK